jgi:hypothetical protein
MGETHDCEDVKAMHPVVGFNVGFIKPASQTKAGVIHEEFEQWFRRNAAFHLSHVGVNRQISSQNFGIAEFCREFFQPLFATRHENQPVALFR